MYLKKVEYFSLNTLFENNSNLFSEIKNKNSNNKLFQILNFMSKKRSNFISWKYLEINYFHIIFYFNLDKHVNLILIRNYAVIYVILFE